MKRLLTGTLALALLGSTTNVYAHGSTHTTRGWGFTKNHTYTVKTPRVNHAGCVASGYCPVKYHIARVKTVKVKTVHVKRPRKPSCHVTGTCKTRARTHTQKFPVAHVKRPAKTVKTPTTIVVVVYVPIPATPQSAPVSTPVPAATPVVTPSPCPTGC